MNDQINQSMALARAMLMTDLLTHRLLAMYCATEDEGVSQEMACALELEAQHLLSTLNHAQTTILEREES